jgi:hypothetical protein
MYKRRRRVYEACNANGGKLRYGIDLTKVKRASEQVILLSIRWTNYLLLP